MFGDLDRLLIVSHGLVSIIVYFALVFDVTAASSVL